MKSEVLTFIEMRMGIITLKLIKALPGGQKKVRAEGLIPGDVLVRARKIYLLLV